MTDRLCDRAGSPARARLDPAQLHMCVIDNGAPEDPIGGTHIRGADLVTWVAVAFGMTTTSAAHALFADPPDLPAPTPIDLDHHERTDPCSTP